MTGRIALVATVEALCEQFGLNGHLDGLTVEQPTIVPRYNIAPFQPVIVICQSRAARRAELMRWGFLPSWVKDPKDYPLVNAARVETIRDKPSFRHAIRRRRCILPVSGFYLWAEQGGDAGKQPFFIQSTDGNLMALAGIWETWMGPYGEELDTVANLTIAAQGDVAMITERFPVVLNRESYEDWLGYVDDLTPEAEKLMRLPDDGVLTIHPVSTRVNSVANDDQTLIDVIEADPSYAALISKPLSFSQKSDQLALF